MEDGYYSFYTPVGTYRVTAEKEGYTAYTSPDLEVIDAPVRYNIPLVSIPLGHLVYLPVVVRE